jgi:hypothetical protein
VVHACSKSLLEKRDVLLCIERKSSCRCLGTGLRANTWKGRKTIAQLLEDLAGSGFPEREEMHSRTWPCNSTNGVCTFQKERGNQRMCKAITQIQLHPRPCLDEHSVRYTVRYS